MERCVLESGSHCEIRAALMAGTLGTLIFASMALLRKKKKISGLVESANRFL